MSSLGVYLPRLSIHHLTILLIDRGLMSSRNLLLSDVSERQRILSSSHPETISLRLLIFCIRARPRLYGFGCFFRYVDNTHQCGFSTECNLPIWCECRSEVLCMDISEFMLKHARSRALCPKSRWPKERSAPRTSIRPRKSGLKSTLQVHVQVGR